MIKNILVKIQKLPTMYSWGLLFGLHILSQIIIRFILEVILNAPEANITHRIIDNPKLFFVIAVVIAPLIETLIFQCFVYWILKEGFRCKTLGICICSAIFFGLVHQYSIAYIVVMMSIGFLFQLWYIIYMKKHGWGYAFCLIAIVHSLNNLIGFVINQ